MVPVAGTGYTGIYFTDFGSFRLDPREGGMTVENGSPSSDLRLHSDHTRREFIPLGPLGGLIASSAPRILTAPSGTRLSLDSANAMCNIVTQMF